MTQIIHSDYPTTHSGLLRVRDGLSALRRLAAQARGTTSLAGGLVAGGMAAAIVVAEQVVSAWADGHLLLAWIAMWFIVFALLAIFSDSIRSLPEGMERRFTAMRAAAARRAADERTWEAARADPRLMAELQFALIRAEQEAAEQGRALPEWPFGKRLKRNLLPLDWA